MFFGKSAHLRHVNTSTMKKRGFEEDPVPGTSSTSGERGDPRAAGSSMERRFRARMDMRGWTCSVQAKDGGFRGSMAPPP